VIVGTTRGKIRVVSLTQGCELARPEEAGPGKSLMPVVLSC